MSEPKNAKDMEKLAREALDAVLKTKVVYNDLNGFIFRFDGACKAISHYLLDAYNEGYDDAIVLQSKRNYRID